MDSRGGSPTGRPGWDRACSLHFPGCFGIFLFMASTKQTVSHPCPLIVSTSTNIFPLYTPPRETLRRLREAGFGAVDFNHIRKGGCAMASITYDAYRAKVFGCWLGKSIGGTLGGPWEGRTPPRELTYYDPVPPAIPELVHAIGELSGNCNRWAALVEYRPPGAGN